MTTTAFDEHERSQWAGRATAYQGSFAALCAYPAGALLEAADVKAGNGLLDAGAGTGTVAALACARGAQVVAVDAEPSMLELTRRRVPEAEVQRTALPQPHRRRFLRRSRGRAAAGPGPALGGLGGHHSVACVDRRSHAGVLG